MIGHRQGRIRSIGILPDHGDMLTLPDNFESENFQSLDDSALGRINGKLAHATAIPASATKASNTGESVSKTSGPNVSM